MRGRYYTRAEARAYFFLAVLAFRHNARDALLGGVADAVRRESRAAPGSARKRAGEEAGHALSDWLRDHNIDREWVRSCAGVVLCRWCISGLEDVSPGRLFFELRSVSHDGLPDSMRTDLLARPWWKVPEDLATEYELPPALAWNLRTESRVEHRKRVKGKLRQYHKYRRLVAPHCTTEAERKALEETCGIDFDTKDTEHWHSVEDKLPEYYTAVEAEADSLYERFMVNDFRLLVEWLVPPRQRQSDLGSKGNVSERCRQLLGFIGLPGP